MLVSTDGDLVCAAQQGDVAALGALLERHEAVLLAEAMRLTRDHAQAQDLVQETCLVALRRIDDVRDPGAARAWLLSVLRRTCLMAFRSAGPAAVPLDDGLVDGRSVRPIEDDLERAAVGDWCWTALQELPEPLRATVLLRHFGTWSSYAEIAEVLGIPVGTVRSRLSVARARLADALLASAEDVHLDARARQREEEAAWRAAAAGLNDGTSCTTLAHAYAPDVHATFQNGTTAQGRTAVRASLEDDLAAGTGLDIRRVLVSGVVTVIEARLTNPPDEPLRCPPATCQVHFRPRGETSAVRLYFPPRSSANAPDLLVD